MGRAEAESRTLHQASRKMDQELVAAHFAAERGAGLLQQARLKEEIIRRTAPDIVKKREISMEAQRRQRADEQVAHAEALESELQLPELEERQQRKQ